MIMKVSTYGGARRELRWEWIAYTTRRLNRWRTGDIQYTGTLPYVYFRCYR